MNKKPSARDRILESADFLFTTRGYGNVGINEIISHSRSVKATFYYHFKSKELLCEEWLRMRHEKSVEHHQQWLTKNPFTADHLLQYFDTLTIDLKSSSLRGCPFTNTSTFINTSAPGVLKLIQSHKTFHREFFTTIAAKLSSSSRAEDLGNILFLLYSGAAIECQNAQSNELIETAKQAIQALLIPVLNEF